VSVESDMRIEESASQLSAMFDGELAAAECELLSRRLGRDEALRARWARYALIGAALRSEPVSHVTPDFSRRVGAAIDTGDTAAAAAATRAERRSWLKTLASGTALAAGIAAAAVLVLRNQVARQDETLATITPTAQRVPAPADAVNAAYLMPAETLAIAGVDSSRLLRAPHDYVVPVGSGLFNAAPPASLASYVAAHSEYSSPLVRGGLISHLVSADEPAALAPRGNGAADDEVVIAANDGR
jgi:negative regulator of sigma E activity